MAQISKSRFLLVGIQPKHISDQQAFGTWRELWQLVESYGGQVIDTVIQKREVHDKGMYIGSGKLTEVKQIIIDQHIDVVVLHDEVKPGQLFEMQFQLTKIKPELEVWDRIDLILQIFSQHAHTAEARLQIELASMRHMGPRIYGMGIEMSRQGGGIGTRGIGETNTERMKRHWAAQMKKTRDKLNKLANSREHQMSRRVRAGLKTISLVGYTNAGKTQLYNRLVNKQKFSDNLLFATLDASVGKLYLPAIRQQLLVSDTIGFIQGLPPELLQAFRSTLMESLFADLLLQVIDISDPDLHHKIQVVNDVLADLGLHHRPRVLVFNKIDLQSSNCTELSIQYAPYNPQFISAQTGQGVKQLVAAIEQYFQPLSKL